GLSGLLQTLARGSAMPAAGAGGALARAAGELPSAVNAARTRVGEFFAVLRGFIEQHAEASGEYETRLLLSSGVRRQPAWAEVEIAWENLSATWHETQSVLDRAATALTEGADLFDMDANPVAEECATLLV